MNDSNQKADKNVIYTEWVRISLFVPIMISLLLILIVTTAVITIIYRPEEMKIAIPLCVVFGVFFIFIGLNFRGLRIIITDKKLKISYGLFNKKIIFLKEITSCEIIKASFDKYWGFGIRMGFDSSLAFTTDFKTAIRIHYADDRIFVFSTRNEQKVCELIKQYI